MAHRVWRLSAAALLITVLVSIATFVFLDAGPLHALSCLVAGRDGRLVEYPESAVTADEVIESVRQETTCVPVNVGYVDWDRVPEGQLARSPGFRDSFRHGATVQLWVEGSADQAMNPCRPLGPRNVSTLGLSWRPPTRSHQPMSHSPVLDHPGARGSDLYGSPDRTTTSLTLRFLRNRSAVAGCVTPERDLRSCR